MSRSAVRVRLKAPLLILVFYMNFCKFCNKEAKYQFKDGTWCCSKSFYSCPGYKKKLSEAAKKNWSEIKAKGYKTKADIPLEERNKHKAQEKSKNFATSATCAWCGRPSIKVFANGKGCCSEFVLQCPAIKKKISDTLLKLAQSPSYHHPNTSHPAWNKGLTDSTDSRVAKIHAILKAKYKNGELVSKYKGTHLPEETRKKISISRRKYLEKNPDQVPYLLSHSSKQSYPEKYFQELFEKEGIPLSFHKQIGLYQLDFYNENLMKYVEIDGGTHLLKKVKEKDERRDKELESLGWSGMRISWPEYYKLSFEERVEVVNRIKDFLKNP